MLPPRVMGRVLQGPECWEWDGAPHLPSLPPPQEGSRMIDSAGGAEIPQAGPGHGLAGQPPADNPPHWACPDCGAPCRCPNPDEPHNRCGVTPELEALGL